MIYFPNPLPDDIHITPELADELNIDARLLKILAARGIDSDGKLREYVRPSFDKLHDAFALTGMDAAASILNCAVKNKEKIIVYGDYDVDGVAAVSLMLLALKERSANVSYKIPSRQDEGYGLNMDAVERLAGDAQLLITVDCGITSVEECRRARELGMKVIITDHHQPGARLPDADAIINPAVCGYPTPLCGAGVAAKLLQAAFGDECIVEKLDIVALATIADIVPLIGENRTFAKLGLDIINTSPRAGIHELILAAGLSGKVITAGHVGFQLAPRINAGGRLSDAGICVELLLAGEPQRARAAEIAAELDEENSRRRSLERNMLAQAEEMILNEVDFARDDIIILRHKDWHKGVVGLTASRIAEKYGWPAILMCDDGEECTGSARSIPGVDIYAALSACRDVLKKFGGHKQAAGMTIATGDFDEFKKRANSSVKAVAPPDAYVPRMKYDARLKVGEIDMKLAQSIEMMSPTGYGNASPVFLLSKVRISSPAAIGQGNAHLRCELDDGLNRINAIAFNMGDRAGGVRADMDVIGGISVNRWRQRSTLQCEVKAMQPHSAAEWFAREINDEKDIIYWEFFKYIISGDISPSSDISDGKLQAYAARPRGVLFIAQTFEACMRASHLFGDEMAYWVYNINDRRGFTAVLACPSRICGKPPDWYAHGYTTVINLDTANDIAHAARALAFNTQQLRDAYIAVRELCRHSAGDIAGRLARRLDMPLSRAKVAAHILEELKLIKSNGDGETHMLRAHACSPEDSAAFNMLLRIGGQLE